MNAFKMPFNGICVPLSELQEFLIKGSSSFGVIPAFSFAEAMEDRSKQASKPYIYNKGLLPYRAELLLLVWSKATDRRDWRRQAHNKGLLLSDQNLSCRRFHIFSDFQDTDFLYLDKLYRSDFTAADSSNGASRLFL